jgi:hypothetical protein
MPFDGIRAPEFLAAEKIDEVIGLIGREDRWCKGSMTTFDGRRCLVAAMQAVDAQTMLEPIVLRAIKDVTGKQYRRIERFNDHRSTTHPLVIRVLGRARDILLKEGTIPEVANETRPPSGFADWLLRVPQRIWA